MAQRVEGSQIAEGLAVPTATVAHIVRSLRLRHAGSDELVERFGVRRAGVSSASGRASQPRASLTARQLNPNAMAREESRTTRAERARPDAAMVDPTSPVSD